MGTHEISEHRGAVQVSPGLIADALHLPEGTLVNGARWDFERQELVLYVTHPELPQQVRGAHVRRVQVAITMKVPEEIRGLPTPTYESRWLL